MILWCIVNNEYERIIKPKRQCSLFQFIFMKIISEQNLIDEISKAFRKAKKRMWVAVPFIGNNEQVAKIMGTSWRFNTELDVKILTDIRNSAYICKETYELFKLKAEIKSLAGLHAKIYILDDTIFITSANLTGAAFTKRYEIGVQLDDNKETIDAFNKWWKIAKPINTNWSPQNTKRRTNSESDESDTDNLTNKWKLPNLNIQNRDFKEYLLTLRYYNEFAKIFQTYGNHINSRLPLFQEMDSFFNFLFHDHDKKPSNKYLNLKARKLNESQRIQQFKKYYNDYKKWLIDYPDYDIIRLRNIDFAKKNLHKKKIDSIQLEDIRKIVNSLHCMTSMPINRAKLLNPQNNSIDAIRKNWSNLLHGDNDLLERMQTCNQNLRHFGKSSIRELLSLYEPDKYPVINSNPLSGLRFFGYDIKAN